MSIKPLVLLFFSVGLLAVSAPIFAHHGSASYDSSKVTTVKGTVTEFRFVNPHVQILFDVTDAAGNVQKWIAEGVSVANMSRDGWNKNTLKPGDQITTAGYAAKNGSHSMRLSKIVLSDGKTFTLERAEDYAN
jgi:Family of unknown function (DUF6152)